VLDAQFSRNAVSVESMTDVVVGGLLVAIIVGISGYGWAIFKKRRGRERSTITLVLSAELAEATFAYFLFRVLDGVDTASLINPAQPFETVSRTRRETQVSYPLAAGLQFKCFADWTGDELPPSLAEASQLFERNGWQEVSIDGLHDRRFWFILPSYATKDSQDKNTYRNNWIPAGPRPASINEGNRGARSHRR